MLTAGQKGACAAACASSFEQELLSRARTVGSVLVVRSSPMQVFMTQLDSIRNGFQSAALDCVTGSGRAEDLRDHVRTIHVYERDRFCVQHPDEALFVRLRDIGYDLGVVTYGTETARSHYAHVHEFIRPGGYLVLYLPHRDHYPNIGHSHANAAHKHDFVEQDVISAAQRVAGCRVVHCECHGTGSYDYERRGQIEYSFELVLEKLGERSRP